tara:strand:+ start:275 stop:637 length:363 start_codon:yes stop_codon:yes gene_type:complete
MSTIKVGTLLAADGSTTTQPSIPALDKRMAKAWVNFNGTGTVAIRDSYNVSSITDEATGQYRINFAVAMTNDNYVPISDDYSYGNGFCDSLTTAGFRTVRKNSSFVDFDVAEVFIIILGS